MTKRPASATQRDTTRAFATDSQSEVLLRPRFEGANICTWIGFKHVNYLVEEAVIAHFRAAGYGVGRLFEDFGLGFDIVNLQTRILHALHIDDEVRAVVTKLPSANETCQFRVHLMVRRRAADVKAVSAKVDVVLRRDSRHRGGEILATPAELASFEVETIGPPAESIPIPPSVSALSVAGVSGRVPAELLAKGGKAVMWRQRIPYFYCHHTVRLQMSGLLRNMEEVVDLFLEEHGASIRTLLDEQDWIPVVPVSQISMHGEGLMEEEILTVMEVTQVFKQSTYTARVDTYAIRGEELFLLATGSITHGYAVIENRSDWSLIEFDGRLMSAVK